MSVSEPAEFIVQSFVLKLSFFSGNNTGVLHELLLELYVLSWASVVAFRQGLSRLGLPDVLFSLKFSPSLLCLLLNSAVPESWLTKWNEFLKRAKLQRPDTPEKMKMFFAHMSLSWSEIINFFFPEPSAKMQPCSSGSWGQTEFHVPACFRFVEQKRVKKTFHHHQAPLAAAANDDAKRRRREKELSESLRTLIFCKEEWSNSTYLFATSI